MSFISFNLEATSLFFVHHILTFDEPCRMSYNLDFSDCFLIQLNLEQHWFKLLRSPDTRIFFGKYPIGTPNPQVSHPWIQPAADQKNSTFGLQLGISGFREPAMNFIVLWQASTDFGVCTGCWNQSPRDIERMTWVLGESKVIQIFDLYPYRPTTFKGQLWLDSG